MKNLQIWAKNFNTNIIAAFATTLLLVLAGIIIYILFPENLDINYIQNTFVGKLSHFVDEKAERYTYIINTLLFIPLFCLAYATTKKYLIIKDNIKFLNGLSAVLCISVILFLFIMIPLSLHFGVRIKPEFILQHITLIFSLAGLALILYFFKDKQFFKTKIFSIVSIIFLTVYILKILYFYPTGTIEQTFMEAYHFDAFVYPIFKIETGILPSIDFKNIYGYYPYFYALFSHLTGPLNTFKITFLTTIIFAISWICGIFYIYKITKNKLFALALSIVFIYLTGGNWYYYFQFAPLRIIAFTVLLFLATLYVQKRNFYLIFLGFVTSVLALVWNFETGFVNLTAWTAFLVYTLFHDYTIKDKKLYIYSFKYALLITILLPQ